jgi:hypothetical protein
MGVPRSTAPSRRSIGGYPCSVMFVLFITLGSAQNRHGEDAERQAPLLHGLL